MCAGLISWPKCSAEFAAMYMERQCATLAVHVSNNISNKLFIFVYLPRCFFTAREISFT